MQIKSEEPTDLLILDKNEIRTKSTMLKTPYLVYLLKEIGNETTEMVFWIQKINLPDK